jgi:hypothetical protein
VLLDGLDVPDDGDKINLHIKQALEKADLGKDLHLLKLDSLIQLEGLHEHLQDLHGVLRLRQLDNESKAHKIRLRVPEGNGHEHEEAESTPLRGRVF